MVIAAPEGAGGHHSRVRWRKWGLVPRARVGFCPTPGCRTRSNGTCSSCRARTQHALDLGRGTPAERGYDHHWAQLSKAFLEANPDCERCGDPATVTDHQPTRRQLVAEGVENPDADQYLHPLCAPCHGTKTALEDRRWG